jgi:Zn-dependent protease with chaperone function
MDPARHEAFVPGDDPPGGEGRVRFHRRIDGTTMWQLAVLLVVWAGGALLVAFVAGLAEPSTGVDPRTVVIVWSATGILVFVPPVEQFLARVLLGLRPPSPDQLDTFRGAWARVCGQAGVRGDRYVLRVQHTGALNATAGAGHIVGVTSTALVLQPRQLEAILAHELGHHLGGHAMIGLLHTWYSWPLRTLVRVCGAVARMASLAMAIVRPISALLALALLPLALVSCAGSLLVPLVAIPVTLSTIVMRRSELRADGTAVRLGYGPELLALYRGWAARERPRPAGWRSVRAFFRDTHPRFDVRVRAIEQRLGTAPPA